VMAVAYVFAQSPRVEFINITSPGSSGFKIGDQFEMQIIGAANEPVRVRTTFNGRTDWSPVIAHTDQRGEWSTTGTYGRGDFGGWTVVWTIDGKLASPPLQYSVDAPCLPKGLNGSTMLSSFRAQTCDTAAGLQTFTTPSANEPLRTPDGRTIPGQERSAVTADRYKAEMLGSLLIWPLQDLPLGSLRHFGDEAATLLQKLVGTNALSDEEIQRVLAIIQAAFERRDSLQPELRNPTATVLFLRTLAKATGQDQLKQQIAATIDYVQN
jgi:hypothetical protein